jgi:two-component system CheB/CheR fusion protein
MKDGGHGGSDGQRALVDIQGLNIGLEEAQEMLRAIRHGEVDALLIRQGEEARVFTLAGADYAFRALFETLNEGALTLSSEGIILYANTRFAELVGAPLDRVIGEPFRAFVAKGSEALFAAMFEAARESRGKAEIVLSRPDGGTASVMASMNAIRMEESESACTVVVTDLSEQKQAEEALRRAHDELEARVLARTAELSKTNAALEVEVSERRRLEGELRSRAAQLAEADKRKDEFLSMLAHELRNPLSPILNSVRALERLKPTDPLIQRHTDVIERQIRNLAHLVDDLLDVARITRGAITLSCEVVNLSDVARRAVEAAAPAIEAKRHELSVATPAEAVWVSGDPTRLEQVLVNLLINAAKYSEVGSRIWLEVGLEEQRGRAAARVRDTGLGISAELLPHIFELFVQGARSLDRAQGGLGIGLTLVKSLVEMHGGEIRAASDGAGQGSEFSVLLPVAEAPRRPEAQVASVAPVSATSPVQVLIVEDNVDAAETLAEVLGLLGHEVVVTNDGPAALEAARTIAPRAVVCDLGLPGMTGFDIAKRLREMPSMAGSLLVALSGYGQVEDRRKAVEAGFDVHLTKPVDPHRLAEILGSAGSLDRAAAS